MVVGVLVLAACGGGSAPQGGDDAQPPPSGCGDGVATGAEMCDGSDLAGRTDCRDLGYYESAPLACTTVCELDTSQCSGYCGDDIVQAGHEYCDGADPATTCTELGFGAGAITCAHCAPDLADCKSFGWRRDYLPFAIKSISGTSDADVWAVGAGTLHWDGATWHPVDVGAACGLTYSGFDAVAAVGPGDVWLGFDSVIVHMTPSGCTKNTLGGFNAIQISNIVAIAADDVWLTGFNTTWHFDGQAWTSYDVGLVALWAAGHDDIYGVDGTNNVLHFDGSTWTATALASQRSLTTIWGTGPNDIYAGGEAVATNAVIEHYDGTWTELVLDPHDAVTSVSGTEHRVFAGLHNTNQVRVRDGNGWVTLATPELRAQTLIYASTKGHLFVIPKGFPQVFRYEGTDQRDFYLGAVSSVAPVSPAEIYALAPYFAGNRLVVFDGAAWREDTSLSFVRVVTTALSGEALAISSDGLHTHAGSWSQAASGSPTSGDLMWAASPVDVWVQDSAYRLHHWDGTTDSVCASCTFGVPVRQLWGTSSTDLYAIGYPNIFRHWDGTSWSDAPGPAVFHPVQLFGWSANDIVAVDASWALWHFDGTNWTPMSSPLQVLHVQYLWGTSITDLFAGSLSTVFHFDGVRWSPVKLPTAYWITGIAGTGDTVIFFDQPAHHLVRTHAWD